MIKKNAHGDTTIGGARADNELAGSAESAAHALRAAVRTDSGHSAGSWPQPEGALAAPNREARLRSASAIGKFMHLLERILAVVLLILVSPLLLLIALAIRLDSRGGAIFRQQRLAKMDPAKLGACLQGDHPTTFTLYKFRTYRVDGDQLAPRRARFDFDPATIDHVCLQLKDDPRITRVGRWLRRTSLDEIPNLVNVVLGEMRLIGPRPEVVEMFRYYTDEQKLKFTVSPGITGLAQVNGRGKLSFKQTVDFDLRFVREKSLLLNIWILVKTIKVVILGDGSF